MAKKTVTSKVKTQYVTTDGKVFDDITKAEEYQKTIKDPEPLTPEQRIEKLEYLVDSLREKVEKLEEEMFRIKISGYQPNPFRSPYVPQTQFPSFPPVNIPNPVDPTKSPYTWEDTKHRLATEGIEMPSGRVYINDTGK